MVLYTDQDDQRCRGGEKAVDICRKLGISEQTFYTWKRKYSEIRLSELRELRQLRDENSKLKKLVADLSLDRHMLQEIVRKSCKASAPARFGPLGASRLPGERAPGGEAGSAAALHAALSKAIAIGRKRCACGCANWPPTEGALAIAG